MVRYTRFLKGLAIALTALIGIGLVVAVLLLIFLDEDDYKALTIALVEQATDSRLSIQGKFELNLSMHPSVDITGLQLESISGSQTITASHVALQLQLQRLWSGLIWFENLELDDLAITIHRPEEEQEDVPWQPGRFLPVFQRARISNLVVVDKSRSGEDGAGFSVATLTIGQPGHGEALEIDGQGSWRGETLELSGHLGSAEELLEPTAPYPVNIELRGSDTYLKVSGTALDPARLSGVDLDLELRSPEFSTPLKKRWEGLPALGAIQATAKLLGSRKEYRLKELKAELERPGVLSSRVSGELGLGSFPGDTQLSFSADLADARVWRQFLPASWPAFSKARISGELREEDGHLRLVDAALSAHSGEGLALNIAGTATLALDDQRLPFEKLTADVKFTAPKTTAVSPALPGSLPELGPVIGGLRLESEADVLSARDIRVTAGTAGSTLITITGQIERLPMAGDEAPSGLALDIAVGSKSTAAVSGPLGLSLPEFGPIRATARMVGKKKVLALRDLKVTAGDPGKPLWSASGMIDDLERQAGIKLQVNTDTQAGALLHAWTGEDYPALGTLKGKLSITGSASVLAVTALEFNASLDGVYQARISGGVGQLGGTNEMDLTHDLDIQDPMEFGRLFKRDLPRFKPIEVEGRLSGRLGAENLVSTIGIGSSEARVDLTSSSEKGHNWIRGKVRIPILHLEDLPLGSAGEAGQIPNTGAHTVEAKASVPAPHLADLPLNLADEAEDIPHTDAHTARVNGSEPIFSHAPIDLQALKLFNADLEVQVDEVVGSRGRIDSVNGRLHLQESLLRITPLAFVFKGGKANMELELNARGEPQGRLQLLAKDVPLGAVLESLGVPMSLSGILDLDIDLDSRGRSPHELASRLHGRFRGMVENSRIPKHYFDLVASDVLGWVITKTATREKQARLDCSILGFAVDKGILESNTLVVDGPYATITGTATLNLGRETIDLRLFPKRKSDLVGRLQPVRVTGPITAPRISAISSAEVARSYGTLLLLPQLYAAEKAFGFLSGLLTPAPEVADSPCQKLQEQLQKQKKNP